MVISWTYSDFASVEASTVSNESDSSPAESNFNTSSSTFPQSSSPPHKTNPSQSSGAVRDHNMTLRKYQEAVNELENALKGAGEVWENFKTISGNVSQPDT